MPVVVVPYLTLVLGYALVVALALRSVVRRAGPNALDRHSARALA